MARTGMAIGWKIPAGQRRVLLERFPPRYANVVADHVTLELRARAPLPFPPRTAFVVGRSDDGESLECLVVELNGTTDRPDGSTYHVTWSLGDGRKARESNDQLKEHGWTPLAPIPLQLEPARF